jgi:hypothetical protein
MQASSAFGGENMDRQVRPSDGGADAAAGAAAKGTPADGGAGGRGHGARGALRVCCALLVALAALLGLGRLLQTRDPSATKGMLYPFVYNYAKMDENSIDAFIVGDSSAMYDISPQVMSQETGISSYNAGSPNQSVETSWELVRDVWGHQSPRYVVLEVNELFTETATDKAVKSMLQTALPVLRDHSNWKLLVEGKLGQDGSALTGDLGYFPSDDVVACTNADYMRTNAQPGEIPFWSRVYLAWIQRVCEEHGATLVLVSTPNASEWSQSKHDLVAAWAEAHGLTYLDANTDGSVGIDWSQDSRDGGEHLNRAGGTKLSTWLADRLAEL